MVLLQWCQLQPQGPGSDIAAILFPEPVQVSSIRIFPTGAQPFSHSPDTIALTEPEAFFLDVFFNALPVHVSPASQDPTRDKRPKNLLVPARLAYAGGQTEFAVDMGPEYATRLIIFQGQFQQASLAIYGEVVAERPEIDEYEARPLPASTSFPLSPALDLANSTKPASLVQQLLSLMQAPAPLPLLMRLMFCLKPEKEDWDNPEFPYVYSDLDTRFSSDDIENEVFNLEALVQCVSKPLREDVPLEALNEFADRMSDFLGSDVSDDAYYVAKLLGKSACQQTSFSRTLLQRIALSHVFNEQSLDETTILSLLEAASNIEIARYFSEDLSFMHILETLSSNPKADKSIQKALKRLVARIRGWQVFEEALTTPDGDFTKSLAFLKDISMEEFALGCWLECMLNHESLVNKLSGNLVPEGQRPSLPLLFQERPPQVTHTTFIMFVRALIGVTSVLAMLAWSDSLGDDLCCERTLNVLVVWQGVDGYREILNHCLLLRQMTRRLEWIKNDQDDQRPKKAGILVERLLVGLTRDPQAMLRQDLVTTVLALKPPFCFITTDEMLEMDKLARVAQDGLVSAIEELAFDSLRPFSLRRLRVLRVSVALVEEELSYDDGEWQVLESFWNERSQGLVPRLIAILVDLSDDLNHHFVISPIPRMHQALSELLFHTADDFLRLIARFSNSYPLTTRDLRSLTGTIADLYVCSDAAGAAFSPSSMAYLATQGIRQSSLQVLSNLASTRVQVEPDACGAEVVTRTLLEHSTKHAGRNPVHHILQINDLLDNILPRPDDEADNGHWATSVFPKVLNELSAFSRLLDPHTQFRLIERLAAVDAGEIGIGEWLLAERLNELSETFDTFSSHQNHDYLLVLQSQISAGIQVCELLLSSPTTATWAVPSLADSSHTLDHCIAFILDVSLSSTSLTRLTQILAKHASNFNPDIQFNILLLVLRSAQTDPSIPGTIEYVPSILKSLPQTAMIAEPLRNEIGRALSAYSDYASVMTADTSETLLQILEWLSSQTDIKLTTLAGISPEGFDYLCTTLAALLPATRQQSLASIKPTLRIDEDELITTSTIELAESLTLPLQSMESLLLPQPIAPSTPKGTKTPDILGVVISPPTALLRSPAATGLTKTYMNNDFRQLRQVTSTRLNTSRLPSTHVDEFEHPSPMDLLPAIDPSVLLGASDSIFSSSYSL